MSAHHANVYLRGLTNALSVRLSVCLCRSNESKKNLRSCSRILITGTITLASITNLAVAQILPSEVDSYANQVLAQCPGISDEAKRRAVSIFKTTDNQIAYVVDVARGCEDEPPSLCGTGGCPVAVFKSDGNVVKLLFKDQVYSWEMSVDGNSVNMPIHGSLCGGSGADTKCQLALHLKDGRKSIKVIK
jgi:hypothetical protein